MLKKLLNLATIHYHHLRTIFIFTDGKKSVRYFLHLIFITEKKNNPILLNRKRKSKMKKKKSIFLAQFQLKTIFYDNVKVNEGIWKKKRFIQWMKKFFFLPKPSSLPPQFTRLWFVEKKFKIRQEFSRRKRKKEERNATDEV